jgi:Protein of unknown function (DUF3631)
MNISSPVERPPIIDGNVARFKLLLGDIRDVFAKRDNAPILSVELVKALIAIEGRPWSADANPLTPMRLALMLHRMQIRPRPMGLLRRMGYRRAQFTNAIKRYRPPKNGPGGADAPVAASANGTGQGLSDRRIAEHADWYSERAYWHYSPAAIAAGALDAELRGILRREVGPEGAEVEFVRVIKMVRRE